MIKIHTADGLTHPICLSDERQSAEWSERLKSQRFQSSITGASLVLGHETRCKCACCGAKATSQINVQYSVTRPQDFHDIVYEVETVQEGDGSKGGERIVMYIDDIRLIVTAHKSQPSARVTIAKVGKRRFRP